LARVGSYSDDPAIIGQNFPHWGMNLDFNPLGIGVTAQDSDHILRPVGSWEDPPPSLFDHWQATRCEKGKQIIVKEARKNIMQEFSIMPVAFDKGWQVPAVG
jgi:hypothetical protein